MERRISNLEQRLGGGDDDDGSPLVIIAPNAWSDADRDAWERADILHDEDLSADLIEIHSGVRPRPCRSGFSVIVVPAPAEVEEADEATRAEWCAEHGRGCG
jgi:hypothetical protein